MATELAKAYVQILPSAKNFTEKLKEEIGLPADKAGRHAGGRLSSAIKSTFAAAGVGAAIGKSLTEGMNLEQNLGGTEAVFGAFAASVQKDATEAYKNMGTSASEYMATANKMGSLFQGAGLQQQEALDLSTKAMQRAADVASVMGIDTTMAMESIAGAAKGNFTMMDNLGVAMNATTLQAYALEKGINFDWNTSTQAEKSRLAMQMFFERTAQYEGNFLRESEQTLSGSLGAMKAAFKDLLGNVMLGQNVAPALKNLMSSVVTFGKNLIPALGNILKAIPSLVRQLFTDFAPSLCEEGWNMLSNIVNGIVTAIPTELPKALTFIQNFGDRLAASAPAFIQKGFEMLSKVVEGITTAIPILIERVPTIISTFANIINDNFPTILMKGAQLLLQLVKGILSAIPTLVANIPKIITAIIDVIQAFNWANLGRKIMTFFKDGIIGMVDAVRGAGNRIYVSIKDAIVNLPSKLMNIGKSAMYSLRDTILGLVNTIKASALKVVSGIETSFLRLPGKMLDIGKNLIRGLWNGIGDMTGWILDKIKGFGASVLDGIKDIFGIHSPSKKTTWMGKMLNTGLANGILDNMRPIQKAIDKVTGLTTGTFESELALKPTDMAAKQVPSDGEMSTVVTLLGVLIDKLQSMKVVLDSGEVIGWVDAGLSREDQKNRRGVV